MKQRMSNRTFRAIFIPICAVLFVLCLIATIAMNAFAVAMDDYLGKGEKHTLLAEGTDEWNTKYYEDLYESNTASKEASYALAAKVQDEGSVLLKNNGILPLAKNSTVTPFGYRYLEPIYGQVSSSGSAKWTIAPVTPEAGLKTSLQLNESAVNCMKKGKPTPLTEAAGTMSAGTVNDLMGGDSKIYEYESSIYNGLDASVKDTTAVVVIARAGQEGSDKKYDGYSDGTPHYLALSENEKATIRLAKSSCRKVIVIVASSATMELAPIMSGALEVDAIMQVGHVGEKGFSRLGALLTGEINPSGRTVDIWSSDFTKDPTYQNFGEFTYTNAFFKAHSYGTPSSEVGDGTFRRYYYDYAEDMYMGYRYYETADEMDESFTYGELDESGAVVTSGAVVYPFGYGLSYTKFEQKIQSYNERGNDIEITVSVKNTGSMAGKEVVQLYSSAPYTQFDIDNKIEKPVVQLAAFGKTELIQPDKTAEVTLTIAKDDLASYCYTHTNKDGTLGSYVLEKGAYALSLRANSHTELDSRTFNVSSTIWYEGDNLRPSEKEAQSALDENGNAIGIPADGVDGSFVAASNRFQECSDYMNQESTVLSRANWKGTFPVMDENRQKALSANTIALFGIEETFNVETDAKLGNVPGSVVYTEADSKVVDNGLLLSDMRGKDYHDESWNDLLDQIDYSDETTLKQIVTMMTGANYTTTKVEKIGLPDTKHADGANGIKAVKTNEGMELSATYGYAPLMASTWNVELMYEVGNMFGKEAMENGISGWYSPAINLHRSPFSGRVFEYYSEDPVLTGKLAASIVSGAGDSGMYCYIKHFALNDQETNRQFFVHTWATEQTMRELYLRAFEIPLKEAKMTLHYISDMEGTVSSKTMRAATAIMASQNNIGPTVAHANYALLVDILHTEWGFKGTTHTDMFVWMGSKAMYDLSFRSGSDTFLTYASLGGMEDKTSATSHAVMRRAVHNVAYTIANSAMMQGAAPGSIIVYDMSPWRIAMIAANVVIDIFVVGMVAWMVLRARNEKKNPEKYKKKK